MLNQLIHLTSVFVKLFVEGFSVIFKNITHSLYKQKRPYKAGRTVYMGKNVPPKWDPGFMKVGSLLGGRIYFHINRFWFFNRILLSDLAERRPSLCRDVFSPYKYSLNRVNVFITEVFTFVGLVVLLQFFFEVVKTEK